MHHKHYTKINNVLKETVLTLILGASAISGAYAQDTITKTETLLSSKYHTVTKITLSSGTVLEQTTINGPPRPPVGFDVQRQAVALPIPDSAAGTNVLPVPAFNWVFGCSAVSGAMVAGYYDRTGYPNMYTGPTNGGIMPLDNSSWPTWSDGSATYPNCPLIASKAGIDGRAADSKGSIDDYWIAYNSTADDPYVTGAWTQHTWGTAIGDYMKTSQSAYNNSDGSTAFYNYNDSASPLICSNMVSYSIDTRDGTYGRKLFYEARGYTVSDCYNQKTDNNISGGFSFAQFKAEIDAGRPVMLNLEGHTVVGVGYDESTNPATIYIHDTWDYNNHTMTWGGSYSGMNLLSVSIVNLASLPSYTVTPSAGGNGSISPNTPQTVSSGSTTIFTITPNTGYEVVTPIGGTCPQGSYNTSTNIYTTGAIVADCTVAPVFAVFYPLIINHVSTAAGVVNGGGSISGSGISCSSVNGGTKIGTCSASFSSGSTVTLAAAADANSTFTTFSGPAGCTTAGGCSFSITADTTVTGSFAGAYKTKIDGGNGYDTLTLAHTNAGSGATILARELHNATTLAVEPFTENLTVTKPIILKGGYDAGFSSNTGIYSTLAGILTIGGTTGSLTVENLTIK